MVEEELASSNQQYLNSNFALGEVTLKRVAFKGRVSEMTFVMYQFKYKEKCISINAFVRMRSKKEKNAN